VRAPLLLLLAASGGLLAPACVSLRAEDRLFVSTEPPGASVYVNGQDTGFTTPTWLRLGMVGAPRVTLRLKGHRAESFLVGSSSLLEGASLEAAESVRYLDAPLFSYLAPEDVLVPIRIRLRRAPGRVHLKLLPV
jgi:hypothetical protein